MIGHNHNNGTPEMNLNLMKRYHHPTENIEDISLVQHILHLFFY